MTWSITSMTKINKRKAPTAHLAPDITETRKFRRQRTISSWIWRFIVHALHRDFSLQVDEIDLLNQDRPNAVGCEITNVCNADCSFCVYGKKGGDERKKSKLDMEVLRHTLKLADQTGDMHFTLSPILGEVSADKRWLDMVKEIRSHSNIKTLSCYTNAILLDRFGSEDILTSGITSMTISTALGSKDQYERLYGVEKYETVVENILDLLRTNVALGKPVNLEIQLRIDKPFSNFLDSDLYGEILKYLPAEKIYILDDAWENSKGLLNIENLPTGHKFRAPHVTRDQPCSVMFRKLEVLMDGTIQACACRVEPELWLGNIKDHDTIESAWHSPQYEKLRNDWFDGKMPKCCETCTHYMPANDLVKKYQPAPVMKKIGRKLARLSGLQ